MRHISHYTSKSPAETAVIAASLFEEYIASHQRLGAMVIALEGELGAGKTTFAQGFAKALGVKRKITSPTFVLLKRYPLQHEDFKFLYHIDAYRLKDHKELIALGVIETFSDPKSIVLIEWSDRVEPILPKNHLVKLHFDHLDPTTRRITISWPKN